MADNESDAGAGAGGDEGGPAGPSVEERATAMGWVSKEDYHGSAPWRDAQTFVSEGEKVLPLLQANNRKLLGELQATRGELNQVKTALAESNEAIGALKEFRNELALKDAKAQRRDLNTQIEEARKEGNTERVVELQETADELTSSIKEVEGELKESKETKEKTNEQPARVEPTAQNKAALAAFTSANPWFGQDEIKTGIYLGIAQAMRAKPENADLKDGPFYTRVLEEMNKQLGVRRSSKTEGGTRGTGQGGGGSGGSGKSFADLPADAKAACERQGKRLVGPNRAYKTNAEWQSAYLAQYKWD